MPVTQAVWIVHETFPLAVLRGTLQVLEEKGALDYAQITVIPLAPGTSILHGTTLHTYEELPAQGFLALAEEELNED